jgi:hypothetical protein
MKKLLVLSTLVVFSSFFALPSMVWAELDCKWEQLKEKDGIACKCIGKDCEKCTKDVKPKAKLKPFPAIKSLTRKMQLSALSY